MRDYFLLGECNTYANMAFPLILQGCNTSVIAFRLYWTLTQEEVLQHIFKQIVNLGE